MVHLHGGHTPATSDGHPTDVILPADGSVTRDQAWAVMMAGMPGHEGGHSGHRAPGHTGVGGMADGSRTYTYPLDQRAATLWYQEHWMSWTGRGVWRGLAGFHLARDDEEESLPLPRGERDIPLTLTDRAFGEDGDTVDLPSTDAVEVAVRFTDHAGTFVLHCHHLEHEDVARVGDFVTE